MASTLTAILLSLALLGYVFTAPAATEQPAETTTPTGDEIVPILEVIQVVEEIPAIVELVEPTTTAEPEIKEPVHKVAKRSALRGDNPSNDLLANYDGLLFDNGQAGLDGRRIKFLPTWVG